MDTVIELLKLRVPFFFGIRGVRRRQGLLTPSVFCSSSISKVIGYADSDYVVENITIRISP